MPGGLVQAVSNAILVTAVVVMAISSTMVLAEKHLWFWAILAATMQLTIVGQWWLSHRQGGVAAATADRFLGLVAVTLLVLYLAFIV
jgi:hypothetical protein